MNPLLLCALLALPQAPAPQAPPSEAAYRMETKPLTWAKPIPMDLSCAGILVSSLTFEQSKAEPSFFDFTGAPERAVRAFVKVTNTSRAVRWVAMGVVVEGQDGRAISAVTTGKKRPKLHPGETDVIELRFTLLKEEVLKGAAFKFILEPRAE
ncbi:MAG TPA: hypothetical protein VJ623_00780 [Holophagaceae bacterium]|nr:hypothetical protein [Holophagaceae bacterium]